MDSLTVKIVSPQEDIFAGPATSVSSKNTDGAFDVLYSHANFITLIRDEPIRIRKLDNQEETFRFPLSIMHVSGNQVTVYTNITAAATPEEFLKN